MLRGPQWSSGSCWSPRTSHRATCFPSDPSSDRQTPGPQGGCEGDGCTGCGFSLQCTSVGLVFLTPTLIQRTVSSVLSGVMQPPHS